VYDVDALDTVVEIDTLPQCDVGAPSPALVADEEHLELAYISRTGADEGESITVVKFTRPYAHIFGPPNDEAFEGHPLASRGLEPYAAFRIENSSWIRRLERMNSVHEFHRPADFAALEHFVLAFHDSTFECVASGMSFDVRPAGDALVLSVSIRP
jgi:hypothetical protein